MRSDARGMVHPICGVLGDYPELVRIDTIYRTLPVLLLAAHEDSVTMLIVMQSDRTRNDDDSGHHPCGYRYHCNSSNVFICYPNAVFHKRNGADSLISFLIHRLAKLIESSRMEFPKRIVSNGRWKWHQVKSILFESQYAVRMLKRCIDVAWKTKSLFKY